MAKKLYPVCARCTKVVCFPMLKTNEEPPLAEAPAFCPMKLMPEVIAKAIAEYDKPEVREFARLASVQEFECYEHLPEGRRTKIPRIEELIQFSHKCDYKKLGIAFCTGLANEARILTDILENKGFEVVSVRCKVGATPKERIGIREEEKIRDRVRDCVVEDHREDMEHRVEALEFADGHLRSDMPNGFVQ